MAEVKTELMTLNMGPQHPSTHGVIRFQLETDGEVKVEGDANTKPAGSAAADAAPQQASGAKE